METARTLTRPDGLTLHYRLWRGAGPRPLLVLLHGVASNLTRWSEFVEYTALKQDFNLLRPDLRGHGASFTRGKIGMEIWCDDLEAILLAEGYERAIFIGHSLGANVALHLAARRPARVTGLVLIDPVLTQAVRGIALWIRRLAPLLRVVAASLRWLNRLGLHRRQMPTRDLRQLDEHVRINLLGAGRQEDFVRRYTSPLADLKYFGSANYLQEMVELMRPIPPAPDLRVPILVLISQALTFTDTAATKAAIARYANAQVQSLSAHHWPLTEKPVEVRQVIETWCAQFAARTSG